MTDIAEQFHINYLLTSFEKRKAKNPRYSLRAYSRFLEIDPSSLSKILQGKRKFPSNSVSSIVTKFAMDENTSIRFYKSVLEGEKQKKSSKKEKWENWNTLDNDDHYKVIAEWEYFALISLAGLDNFEPTISHISDRLGISLDRAGEVLNDLLEIGMIKEEYNGELRVQAKNIKTTNEISSNCLLQAHKAENRLALRSLNEDDIQERGFYSATVMTNQKMVDKVKALSFEYIEKIINTLETGPKDEVYQVGIQLYPLTRSKGKQ